MRLIAFVLLLPIAAFGQGRSDYVSDSVNDFADGLPTDVEARISEH